MASSRRSEPDVSERGTSAGNDGTVPGTPGLDGSAERLSRPATPRSETFGLRALYHVPRSQVWGGSRGRQSGHVHLHATEALIIGRIRRMAGQALCGKRGWYEREPLDSESLCPRCAEIRRRL